jgi:hypothetical protein
MGNILINYIWILIIKIMAIPIPNNFDYKLIALDDLEIETRDSLAVNIENWAKFRHVIAAGTDSSSLHSNHSITSDIKNSYLELGKSHYEAVTSLGIAKLSLISLLGNSTRTLQYKKNLKEFYFHAGSILDNLARLIYIINIPDAPTKVNNRGYIQKYSMYFSTLKDLYNNNNYKSHLKGYKQLIYAKEIKEIMNIRNSLAHSWPPITYQNKNTGESFFDYKMVRKKEYYLWPHDAEEIKKLKKQKRRKRIEISIMVQMDWQTIETLQSKIFKYLYRDIKKFEANHNLVIS